MQKPYPIYDKNGRNQLKLIPYLWPKQPKNHTLWGRTYLYSPNKGVPPHPGLFRWPQTTQAWPDFRRKLAKLRNTYVRRVKVFGATVACEQVHVGATARTSAKSKGEVARRESDLRTGFLCAFSSDSFPPVRLSLRCSRAWLKVACRTGVIFLCILGEQR